MHMTILLERICRRWGTCTLSICLARTRSPITTCGYGILSRRQCEGCQVIIGGTCPRGNSTASRGKRALNRVRKRHTDFIKQGKAWPGRTGMEECEETNQNCVLVISPFHIEDCLPLMNKGQSDQHAVWMPEVVLPPPSAVVHLASRPPH